MILTMTMLSMTLLMKITMSMPMMMMMMMIMSTMLLRGAPAKVTVWICNLLLGAGREQQRERGWLNGRFSMATSPAPGQATRGSTAGRSSWGATG